MHIHHDYLLDLMDENYDEFVEDWDFQLDLNLHYWRKKDHWKKRKGKYVDYLIDLIMKEN